MAKISPAGYRFSAPADGVQVNFCKNVRCSAFGVPESPYRTRRAPGTAPAPGDYTRLGANRTTQMKCGVCGSSNPMRSNQAVVEEPLRVSAHMFGKRAPTCSNRECTNHLVAVTEIGRYAKFGKTRFGTPRWRCNVCRKTFAEAGAPLLRQRKTHKNRDVFLLLVNKSPLKRIMEVTGLSAEAVYGKIAFVHRQCLAFAGGRELQLLQGMTLPTTYLAVDRQAHNVNWSNRRDRRNVVLNAVASADLDSGYVFGFHLNFDPTLDAEAIEKEATATGDDTKQEAERRFARVWLNQDYNRAVASSAAAAAKKASKPALARETDQLAQGIAKAYDELADRDDVEVSEEKTAETALPAFGMQVKEQYTLHGHFQLLAKLLQGAEKVRVYMDQDSGIRAAFLGTFAERVKQRSADGWYVSVLKETTHTRRSAPFKLPRHGSQTQKGSCLAAYFSDRGRLFQSDRGR